MWANIWSRKMKFENLEKNLFVLLIDFSNNFLFIWKIMKDVWLEFGQNDHIADNSNFFFWIWQDFFMKTQKFIGSSHFSNSKKKPYQVILYQSKALNFQFYGVA